RRAPTTRTLVRPVVLRMGSPSARAEKSFAFSLSGDDLLLAGPAKLAAGECVSLDIAAGAIQARGLVCSETPAGHKAVRLDHVFTAEEGALERWQAGAVLASRSAA